jgi:hypothetical protein
MTQVSDQHAYLFGFFVNNNKSNAKNNNTCYNNNNSNAKNNNTVHVTTIAKLKVTSLISIGKGVVMVH